MKKMTILPGVPRPERAEKPENVAQMTHPEGTTRPRSGQLNRDVQRRLGDTLRAMYDEVVNEGVPPRLVELLKRIDEKRSPHASPQGAAQGARKQEENVAGSEPGQETRLNKGDKPADNGAI